MVETILQRDDALRLQKAATQMLVIGAQTIALEGQPLYADEEWGQFHQFAYAHVIPQLAQFLSAHNVPIGLDVLYDEFTTSNNPLNAEHFMGLTMQALGGVPINIPEEPAFESAMVNRGDQIFTKLQESGRVSNRGGLAVLESDSGKMVELTTRGGRLSCAVLDAAFQTQSAESGTDTKLLVHDTRFRGQQNDMLAVLSAYHNGLPFQLFGNVFFRDRNGMRLAGIRLFDSEVRETVIT